MVNIMYAVLVLIEKAIIINVHIFYMQGWWHGEYI